MESNVRPSKRACRREDTVETSTNEFANYDVFISHRGPDTKTGFVSYLVKDLKAVGLQPFLDCRSIDMGEESWECIENAIKKTPIAVVIFSESFAASEWCLRELDVMLGTPGVKVLPIFYNVRPSEVRFLGSSRLKDGFEKLSTRHNKTIIEGWRERLEEASKIMGWEHEGAHKRLEAELVSDVVGKILALANKPLPLAVGEYVFGVKQIAEEIIETLENKKEVLILGLWGMGGIGKSTLAKELYNQLNNRYDSACYVEDVTEKVTQAGVVKVQQEIMEVLCKNNPKEIKGKSMGKSILEERLCKKRFLLVLDDVCDNDDLEYWISWKMMIEGSKCIITSRNRNVFETITSFDDEREVHIHDVKGLSIMNSKLVFMSYAFGGSGRMEAGFEELVSRISKVCGGVPLVLKVCGALLKKKANMDVWKEVMAKLDNGTIMDERKIFECLRTSYDALSVEQQEMFLDIACALIGERKDLAVLVWRSLNRAPELGICSLMEKALITVDTMGCLKMHDHLRDMGREIVKKKRESEGIIRHLWMPESLALLEKNKQLPDSLQTLVLSCNAHGMYGLNGHTTCLDTSHMMKLRILMCNGPLEILSLPKSICWFQHLNQSYVDDNLPMTHQSNELANLKLMDSKSVYMLLESFGQLSNLGVLKLCGYRELTILPNSFGGLKKMGDLKLYVSGIENLPRSCGHVSNLEALDLSSCKSLTVLPDSFGGLKKMRDLKLYASGIKNLPRSFGELSNLEVLDLSWCNNLTMLLDSFGGLKKMRDLKLDASGIENLPRSFGELSNLEVLGLSSCDNLTMLPDSFGGLKKMRDLKLDGTGIKNLPRSFGELSNLEVLRLSLCDNLTMLPDSFGGLKKMRDLKLYASGIKNLPRSFGELSNLEVLDLSLCHNLTMLPDSFGELSNLEVLGLSSCDNLTMLPDSFGGLKKMRDLKLDGTGIKNLPRSFGELSNLEVLGLSSCDNLTMLPDSFGGLKKMRDLKLDGTGIKNLPRSFGELSNLEVLGLSSCDNLTMLPDSFGELSNLEVLDLSWCNNLTMLLDSFGGLKKMRDLKLDASGIENLPRSFGELSNLEVLDLSSCDNLTMLPDSFGELSNLEVLRLSSCDNLTMLPDSFGGLKKMRDLKLYGTGIKNLPRSFGELSNLEVLGLSSCDNLTMLPDSLEASRRCGI